FLWGKRWNFAKKSHLNRILSILVWNLTQAFAHVCSSLRISSSRVAIKCSSLRISSSRVAIKYSTPVSILFTAMNSSDVLGSIMKVSNLEKELLHEVGKELPGRYGSLSIRRN